MKYCTKCGNKLNQNSKFCSKCGNPIGKISTPIKKEEIKIKNKEEGKEKLLLIIGTVLVIVASFIFAIATWNEMTSIFKVLFLAIESLLFLSLSIFGKKIGEKMPYKTLWFIGISFIPIILNLVAYDGLLGEYLSYAGSGIHVYLAISTFICSILYYFSYRLLKNNAFLYTAYAFVYLFIISLLLAFKLDYVKGIDLTFPILNLITLLICIFYLKIKDVNYNKTINRFISVVTLILSILTCAYVSSFDNYIINAVTFILSIAALLILLFKSEKNVLVYILPIMIYITMNFGIYNIFSKYASVATFALILSSIFVNLIINQKDNKAIKIISFIWMTINIFILLLISNFDYRSLFACFTILLIFSLFIIKLYDIEFEKVVAKLTLPINIFLIINSFIKIFKDVNMSYIYLISSVICFTIYIIFHQKSKDKFMKSTFEIFSYIYLALSSLEILFSDVQLISFILNEIVWLYYFIFNSIIKRSDVINTTILVTLFLNFIFLSIKFDISVYYSLLFISIISLILDYIKTKINNKKSIYIYISIAACAIATLSKFSYISIFGIGLNVLTYISSYYLLVKNHNTHFAVKFIYTIIGFTLISSIYHYFISNDVIANILILCTYIIILTSMYLLQVDSDRKIFSYSIVILPSYLYIVNNVDILYKYSTSLISIIIVFLILIYFEKVFNLKDNEKSIFELVLLGLLHLVTIVSMLIADFILAAFYIFYGLYKKRESFTIFGTVLLIATLVINLFKIADNITVTFVLLIIGIIMLAYVFYIEAKKNKK